jgi:hypothetical protein
MSCLKAAIMLLALATVSLGSRAGTVSLSVGGEVTEFAVTHCRTDTHLSGQLQVEAELTAVGTFRGRPATLLLSKVSNANSENIDLHLIELAPELRTLSSLTASGQITMDYSSELGRREREINTMPDPEELANLPPEEAMARMNAAIDAQVDGLDAIRAQMDAEFAHTRSFGAILVSGSTIEFEGSDTRVIRGDQVEAFANVAGAPVRVTAECGD